MVKKKRSKASGHTCVICGSSGCGCMKGVCTILGLILIVLGVVLWLGKLSLEATFAILFVLAGICSLWCSSKCK